MPNRALQGIVPALVTPFRQDERIDFNAWQAIIDMQVAAGVDGLFACGSQGESYALDMEERQVAMRFVRQAVAGRVPICGNVGTITTRDTIKLAQQAEEIGIDYLAVITPYYLRLTQDEIAEHFIEVCRAVRTPVLAYNYPLHGAPELQPETLGRIAGVCENMVGLKDSSGKLEQSVRYLTCAPGREMLVLVGTEANVVPALERGCAGAVTAAGNLAPRLFVDLYRAFREGNRDEVAKLQPLAAELGAALGLHTFPAVVKEGMRIAGLPGGPCRRPVGQMPPDALARLEGVVSALRQHGYIPTAPKAVVV